MGSPFVSSSPLELLYRALNSERGVIVELASGEYEGGKSALIIARRKAKDPDLDCLTIGPGPFGPTQIWIMKNAKS